MNNYQKEFVLYGLENYKEIIDRIIGDLGACDCCFDIKLLLTEAIANAFSHGNKKDSTLPIKVRCRMQNETAIFEIQDCGRKEENLRIPDRIDEQDLLLEDSRGLFLINCYADKVSFKNGKLTICKKTRRNVTNVHFSGGF